VFLLFYHHSAAITFRPDTAALTDCRFSQFGRSVYRNRARIVLLVLSSPPAVSIRSPQSKSQRAVNRIVGLGSAKQRHPIHPKGEDAQE
jgi:hypothetical protein